MWCVGKVLDLVGLFELGTACNLTRASLIEESDANYFGSGWGLASFFRC